ncbi:MAG: rhomboid family intramembrane serine protease [Phycisphaerae bacterium]|nr:rhomboid family intramembrane serine protease [Phycisphaerae bacterium]
MIIPIRTEAAVRKAPHANHLLIGLNLLFFLLFNSGILGQYRERMSGWLEFHSAAPALHEFFTYQFMHADVWHVGGNMLFLWVFGNAVNGKMGDLPYLCFYLSGGVFSAWGYAVSKPEFFTLIGASGSIAAVTTAYLALFPRSRVTCVLWFLVIYVFELPAMVLIGLKIIVWDNIVAPGIGGANQVAHGAHLAGYFFGLAAVIFLLLVRALPRDQFDIVALWKRWNQRRALAAVMANPQSVERAQYGALGRVIPENAKRRAEEDQHLDRISAAREAVAAALLRRDQEGVVRAHEALLGLDARQCLSERDQLAVARVLYEQRRFQEAAAAFERFLECYPQSVEGGSVRLLLGIIFARDLGDPTRAEKQLAEAESLLQDESRRRQCAEWLHQVRQSLGNGNG